MSMGPLGLIGSFAGSPLSQTRGSEVERSAHEQSNSARKADAAKQAENAAGIGQTEREEQAGDRDADGRRPWEIGSERDPQGSEKTSQEGPAGLSRDPHGHCGTRLDLNG